MPQIICQHIRSPVVVEGDDRFGVVHQRRHIDLSGFDIYLINSAGPDDMNPDDFVLGIQRNDSKLLNLRIPAYPDGETGGIRTLNRKHPDTCRTIKRSMDAGYCLTKGLPNVSGEFSLAFFAYNLRRAISILGGQKLIKFVSS